jgi:hypothetical protein
MAGMLAPRQLLSYSHFSEELALVRGLQEVGG